MATAEAMRMLLPAEERAPAGCASDPPHPRSDLLPSVSTSLSHQPHVQARTTRQPARPGRQKARSGERRRAAPPLITLEQQVLPNGAIRMDMPLHAVIDTAGLRSTAHCPAVALRRSKPAFIDVQAGDLVETLVQKVLHALARANRLGSEFMDKFDSHSVQLVPAASVHKIALDRGGSLRLWQYFATEIMEGVEVKLHLMLTPPPPPHARGYKVQTAQEKAASAKAAARIARERARRMAKVPHPPTEPRAGVGRARVDRLDTVAARVVNRVQAAVEARQQCNAEFDARKQEIEEAILAMDRVNEKRVELDQKKISQFVYKPPKPKKKSGRDLAAHVIRKRLVTGFVPMQQMRLDKEGKKPQAPRKVAKEATKPVITNEKLDDIRPPFVEKKLGFAGLPSNLRPTKPKSRIKVESRENADLSKEGAKVLTTEERLQRQSDQIAYVLNNMISGKRKLYGTMMRNARSAFEIIDKDGNGSLDYSEFAAFLRRLGLGLNEEQTTELAKVIDADGSGEIDCDEFVAALKAAETRAKEDEGSSRRQSSAENEVIRKEVAKVGTHGQDDEDKKSVVEHMRARILRIKRYRENYAYMLTGPHSLAQAAGFGSSDASKPTSESVASSNAEMRVTLPGTHGVTVAIHTSQSGQEPKLELEREPASEVDEVDEKILSSDEADFTATDYIEVVDEMEAAEVIEACRHWNIAQDDISSMRENLRHHYMQMYENSVANDEAEEVPEDSSKCDSDQDCDEDGRSQSTWHTENATADVEAPAPIPVEEVTGASETAVQSALAKVYAGMDIEKENAAVALALRTDDTDEDPSEDAEKSAANDVGYEDDVGGVEALDDDAVTEAVNADQIDSDDQDRHVAEPGEEIEESGEVREQAEEHEEREQEEKQEQEEQEQEQKEVREEEQELEDDEVEEDQEQEEEQEDVEEEDAEEQEQEQGQEQEQPLIA